MVVIPLFIVALFFVYNEQFYIAAGGYIGLVLGYFLEKRYVKYEVKEIWWVQLLKFLIGMIGALLIKEGTKPLFALMGDHYIFDLIRYFLVALWASRWRYIYLKYYLSQMGNPNLLNNKCFKFSLFMIK